MMRKKIVSLCMALALCLSLLPATALAAAPGGQVIYVGNKNVTNGGYWTTHSDGSVTPYTEGGKPTENYIHYSADTNTLTLHNATIKKGLDPNESIQGGTYILGSAIGVFNQDGNAELTIQLEGDNTIEDVGTGIYVLAPSPSTSAASLTIKGSGSLTASGSLNGIMVQSNSGDATLTIQSADVTLTSNSGNGVTVQAGSTDSSGGHTITLSVEGGSLTASGSTGISFDSASSNTVSATKLTVSNNAIVRANDVGSKISNVDLQIGKGNNSSGGIVFDGNKGTVYGDVTLQENLTIGEGERLDIPSGASLTIDSGATLTVNGGELTGNIPTNGVVYKVTGVTLSETTLTLEVGGTATLTATIMPDNATDQNVTWSSDTSGIVTIAPSTDTKTATITATGTGTTTIKATVGGKSAECTVTVNAAATVQVESVSLDKTNLELTEGETAQLNATVLPETATNRNVTWSSNAPGVATVDSSGKVTAVAPGTATITVTTQDGNHTAACTVTVRPDIPPANPNYRITVEATQGGAVTADPTAAKAGTTVTLTPVPDRGYQVGTVAVTDRFGDAVAVTEQAGGTYTFTMPNGQVTVTVTFEQAPLPFHDVTEGDWFYDAVRYAYETGLMDGVGDSLFAPNSETTRAQLVTILYRLAGQPAVSGDLPFTDVESGTWYTDAILWAAQNNIVNGVNDTEFAPGADITREQLVTILYRYAESKGYDVSASADLSGYPDAGQVQDYAQPAMAWAVAEGIVEGVDGNLNPTGDATRAQIATILMRFCEGVGQ